MFQQGHAPCLLLLSAAGGSGCSLAYSACMLSHAQPSVTPWTAAQQTPLSMEFSRQEYWSGLPFPTSGDLPNPETELLSLASSASAGGFFITAPPVNPGL